MSNWVGTIEVNVAPINCDDCNGKLIRIRKTSSRKGVIFCSNNSQHNWYGRGRKFHVRKQFRRSRT